MPEKYTKNVIAEPQDLFEPEPLESDEDFEAENVPEVSGLWLEVAESEAGQRLDHFLAARYPEFSRAQLTRKIKEGQIRSESRVLKASSSVVSGQKLAIVLPEPPVTALTPNPEISLNIVYEDEHVLIVDKPAGLVVHPGAGYQGPTLAGAILAYNPQINGVGDFLRPGLVHRLDKDTSGLLITAKNEAALRFLARSFHDRQVEKFYLAFIRGRLKSDRGVMDAVIGRHPTQRHKMAAGVSGGREAKTIFCLLRYFPKQDVSLLRLRLITGRTHQIRVHLSAVGHPILGDAVYGRGPGDFVQKFPQLAPYLGRQLLHARRLTFLHPATGAPVSVSAPWPSDFRGFLSGLLQ